MSAAEKMKSFRRHTKQQLLLKIKSKREKLQQVLTK